MYVEFGATRACFVTKQGQESINRKSATTNIEIVEEISMFFYERVNRVTSRDYNPIFDTDFASLVRYDRLSFDMIGF